MIVPLTKSAGITRRWLDSIEHPDAKHSIDSSVKTTSSRNSPNSDPLTSQLTGVDDGPAASVDSAGELNEAKKEVNSSEGTEPPKDPTSTNNDGEVEDQSDEEAGPPEKTVTRKSVISRDYLVMWAAPPGGLCFRKVLPYTIMMACNHGSVILHYVHKP